MRNLMSSAAAMRPVKEEFITIHLEDDDEDENVFCGEVEVECMMDAEEIKTSDDDGDDWDTKIDHQYMYLLDSFREDGNSYLSDNPLRSIRYEVDNGGYDNRRFKAPVTKEDRNTVRVVTKKNAESKPHHVQASSRKTTTKVSGSRQRRENSVAEKSVEPMLITTSHHVKRNSQQQHSSGNASEKEENLEDHDENYKAYLTWLVENFSKNSTTTPDKEIQVKCEEEDYTMSLSDSDSDTIVVGDRPFLDEDVSPFVPSKSYKVVDLDDKRSDERSSWFRKEIMNVLKQPYTVTELMELHNEASVHRRTTRHIELRDGTEFDFKTKKKRPSYLDEYPDFKNEYEDSLREKDERKALNLLRGFIFYLTNVVRDDAFKPWLDHECLKTRCF